MEKLECREVRLWRSQNAEKGGYVEVRMQRSEAMEKFECREVRLCRSCNARSEAMKKLRCREVRVQRSWDAEKLGQREERM